MKPRVLVLYEYSIMGLPHSSAYLRLLRPLTHPVVQERFFVTPSPVYNGQAAEIVIVDRSWRPDLTGDLALSLIEAVRQTGAKLLYHLDDDLLATSANALFTAAQLEGIQLLLREADAIMVSTPILAQRIAPHNRRVLVVPNALDERLLIRALRHGGSPFRADKLRLGYMGTRTHDADLRLILPALAEVGRTAECPLELQVIGGAGLEDTWALLRELPFPVRQIDPPSAEYPHFMLWFTGFVHWDVALAPLLATPFNQCKSDVKFLDYSALGAAGIYSRESIYAESVIHRFNGWLAANTTDEWSLALSTLIGDTALRRELAANARRQLYEERVLVQRSPDWIAALETVWYG